MVLYKKGSNGEVVKQIQKALHLYTDGIFGTLTEEAVKEFQKKMGLTVDGIVGPATWCLLFSQFVLKKSSRKISEIIIHCSATPEGKDYTVADITDWHKKRGFATIGYHYVIYRDGSLHNGRDINIIGAHCSGHNTGSIGICYIGGLTKTGKTAKDTRTEEQKATLLSLLLDLKKLYPEAKIYGHHDFEKKKDCPCFDAKSVYRRL